MWRFCVVVLLAAVGLGVGLSWRPPAMPADAALQQWPKDGKHPEMNATQKVPAKACDQPTPPMRDARLGQPLEGKRTA